MARRRQEVEIRGTDKSKAAFASLAASANRTKAAFGALGAGLKGAFLPLVGAAGAISLIRNTSAAMNELDLIAKRARTTGFGTDMFQSLGLAADEANISQGLLNSSLIAFVKRVGEAKNGVGPLVTGLKNGNASLLEMLRNSRNQEQAFATLADAVSKAETATEKAAIANAAFGRSGVEMVRILDLGSQGLVETADKAKRLGLIYERDLLAKQERLNNDLGVFNKVIGVQFKSILVTLAPVLTAVAQTTAEWAKSIRQLFDSISSGASQSLESVRSLLEEEKKTLQILESRKGSFFEPSEAQLQMTRARIQELRALERAAIASSRHPAFQQSTGVATSPVAAQAAAATTVATKVATATKPLKLFNATVKETREEASLLEEGFTTGMGHIESAINDLVTNGKVNFKSLITSMLGDFARLASSNLFKSLGSALIGGGGLFGAGGSGAGSAIAGGLRFGGLFAKGGDIKSGEVGIVGEKGPEFVQGPARVTPMTSSGGPGGGVTVQVNLDARGADASAVGAIQAKLNDMERRLPEIIKGVMAQERRYSPGRA